MNPTPNELGVWLSVFAVVIGLIANIAIATGVFRTQRRQVRLEDNFATTPQLDKMELKMESVRSEMKDDMTELHGKVNAISNQVSCLAGETRLFNQRIAQVDDKLDRMIERRAEA